MRILIAVICVIGCADLDSPQRDVCGNCRGKLYADVCKNTGISGRHFHERAARTYAGSEPVCCTCKAGTTPTTTKPIDATVPARAHKQTRRKVTA